MILTLVITKNCKSCERAEAQLKHLIKNKENINLFISDIKDYDRKGIVIVPALFIDDELLSYGDIDEKKLLKKMMN